MSISSLVRGCKSPKSATYGFSLLELMIVLVMTGFIVMAALRFYAAQQKSARVQKSRSDIQQIARITASKLTEELRYAGYMMPPDTVVGMRKIMVWRDAITGCDSIRIRGNLRQQVLRLKANVLATDVYLKLPLSTTTWIKNYDSLLVREQNAYMIRRVTVYSNTGDTTKYNFPVAAGALYRKDSTQVYPIDKKCIYIRRDASVPPVPSLWCKTSLGQTDTTRTLLVEYVETLRVSFALSSQDTLVSTYTGIQQDSVTAIVFRIVVRDPEKDMSYYNRFVRNVYPDSLTKRCRRWAYTSRVALMNFKSF